jgi:cation diffusion facilitator CzcD-associated flavoprotein CzcO
MSRAFKRDRIEFDVFERLPGVGGIWDISNVDSPLYDATHFISSARMSGFDGYPMPADYPDYPRHDQVLAYLRSYAEEFGLVEHVKLETPVSRVDPSGAGWEVALESGERRRYAGVVMATGHNWDARLPEIPGDFAGDAFHSVRYRSPERLRGKRVLVVGGGNSACDIACDAIRTAESVSLSLRRGYYFLPKHVFGVPADEFAQSGQTSRASFAMMLSMLVKTLERHGVPRPQHKLFEANPVLNSQIIEAITSETVAVRPQIERLCGERVRYADGREEPVDTIIYATGYRYTVPAAAHCLPWQDGHPDLCMNMFPPGRDGLYVLGMFETDGGAFPIFSAQADVVSGAVRARESSDPERAQLLDRERASAPDLSGGRSYVGSERHAISVNRQVFMTELARLRDALT